MDDNCAQKNLFKRVNIAPHTYVMFERGRKLTNHICRALNRGYPSFMKIAEFSVNCGLRLCVEYILFHITVYRVLAYILQANIFRNFSSFAIFFIPE